MTQRLATAAAVAAKGCVARCRKLLPLTLMTIAWAIGSCLVAAAAEDGDDIHRVPRINASGSFGVFWSCGSSFEFSSCEASSNISCAAVTIVGTFNSSITAASVYYETAEIFMVLNQSAVGRLRLSSGELQILYQAAPGLKMFCIAVDWLNQELYLIEDGRVYRCDLNVSSCTQVLIGRATDVRDVAVDPNNGWIFWTTGNGSVWRDMLPTEGSLAGTNRPRPALLAAAGSSCPGRGLAIVSQLSGANLSFVNGRNCNSSQSLDITFIEIKRAVIPTIRRSDVSFENATGGSSGLVCVNASTCLWVESGGSSGRRLVAVDVGRSSTHTATVPTDVGIDAGGTCLVLAPWHRDLQVVPAPLTAPKNVEVLFTTASAIVTWDPPAANTNLIWASAGRTWYESVWRNWMYNVTLRASEVRAHSSAVGDIALTPPELQVCLVQSRGIRRCRFDGLNTAWLYNISITAYSSSGEISKVVRGSPQRDGSPVLIGAVGGLAYTLLHFENGSVLAEGAAGSPPLSLASYSASNVSAAQSVIRDLAVAGSDKLYVVFSNRTVLQTDRSPLSALQQPANERLTSTASAMPIGTVRGESIRFDGCTASPRAEAVVWDWVSGSLYVGTPMDIVRLAAGCSGTAESIVAEGAIAIALEPLVERLLVWITMDRRSLKYCKLGTSCLAGDVTMIYTSPCLTTAFGQCVPEVLSVTVDIDDRMLYWMLKLSPDAKQVQVIAASLSQPTDRRELVSDLKPSTPSLVAHGGKVLWVASGSRLVVLDGTGDAVGSYPLAIPTMGLWLMHNYSRWLLPGFADLDAMRAATRPRRIAGGISVDGSATNFTIRWPYLNASMLVDVLYNITINGTGISRLAVVSSVPVVHIETNSVLPLSPLRVAIVAYTYWVTGEPYISDITVPPAVPPAPSNLAAFVEYGVPNIIWLYWDQDYPPGAPIINTTIFLTKLDKDSSSSADLLVGAAFGSQRSSRFTTPGDGQEFAAKVVSCNDAGCSDFSTPVPVSTEVGKLTPLPRLVVLQSSGLVLDGDFRLTVPTVIRNASLDNGSTLLAAIVGESGVSTLWVDPIGCLHQSLAEAGRIEIQIGCGLNKPNGATVDNNRRRLYLLLGDSTVLQVDLVTMENKTVFHSATDSIFTIAFDKHSRSLFFMTDKQQLIVLDAEGRTNRSAPGNHAVRRDLVPACNCTAATSSPASYTLATTITDGVIVFILDNGTVYRADASLCKCWPIMRSSDVYVPGFRPDRISAGDDRLFAYSKLSDGLLSVDFLGRNLVMLRNISAQYIWPYSTLSGAAPAVGWMPMVDRLTPVNANEVRVTWRCSSDTACNFTTGSEQEALLLIWLRPSLLRQGVEMNSLKLSPKTYVVSHLQGASTYSLQVWVCSRNSCTHSEVYNVTTLHAPMVPLLLNATNESLTFSWTAPPDGSILLHYISLESARGESEKRNPEFKTTAGLQYTMIVHDLTPATDYLARVVVVYRASTSREYRWPLPGLRVSTRCSLPASVAISKADCGRSVNSSCTVALTYADPSSVAKCQVSFTLSISCLAADGKSLVLLNSSSVVLKFVIPITELLPTGQGLRCYAMARAISADGFGPWSSPSELPLKALSPDNLREGEDVNGSTAAALAASLSVVAGVAVFAAAFYAGVWRRRRRKKQQWQVKNRAEREDRQTPDRDGQMLDSLPLVVLRQEPAVDMVSNSAYRTESVLHEPAAPSWGTVNAASSNAKLPKVDRRKLMLLRPLGAGAFGEVFSGVTTLVNDNNEEENVFVAVKTLRSDASDNDKSDFLKEAVLMSNFHHENVVRLIGVCAEADPVYIVIELMQEGDLLDFLRRKRPTRDSAGQLSLHTLLHMSFDIASGCEYLESLHFVHRDLAARNCLVSGSSHADGCPIVKIGDFGLARDVYRNDYYRKEGEAFLPVRWMSPESLVDGVFTNQSDVWSFGVLMWELFSLGMQPYTAKSNVEVLQYVRNAGTLDRPLRCPHSMYRLMSHCWSYVPKERPSFNSVRCTVQQILSEIDQDATLVAAYDRCNGRLTSDQEFFSTSSATEDVPLSARMVRQLSDVFDTAAKPSAAADERVQYRVQNSVKGRLGRMFRRSANSSLLNRVHSQTDPESRKSNIYVRSDSVMSSDAAPTRILSSSRDSAFLEAEESRRGHFGDFILDSLTASQEPALPNAEIPAARARSKGDDDTPPTIVETVNYSLVTPAAKPPKPTIPPASGDSLAVCSPAGAPATASDLLLAEGRTWQGHLASDSAGVPACSSKESSSGSPTADNRSAVNYSLVVALPPLPHQMPQPSQLDGDESSECTAKVHLACQSPDKSDRKTVVTAKRSLPNTYAIDLHKKSCPTAGDQPAAATGDAAPARTTAASAARPGAAGSVRTAGAREHAVPPPVPPPPPDDMGLTAVDYSGEEPQLK